MDTDIAVATPDEASPETFEFELQSPAQQSKGKLEDCLYLIGLTPLKEYLSFINGEALGDKVTDRKQLVNEWRAAHDHMNELQYTEDGWPNEPRLEPVPNSMQPLVDKVMADPVFCRAFSTVPVGIGYVELDRVVAYQHTVNLAHVARLKEKLGPNPTPEQIFRTCLPFDHPTAGYRMGRIKDGYVFVSESNDLRFLEPVVLGGRQISDYPVLGPIAGSVNLMVGFGSNYLNMIYTENRLLLNNGNHRAYALRELGVTHVPCVIQKVTRRDELIVAARRLRRSPDLYLQSARPPVVKDYFNPRLCKRYRTVKKVRQVRVTYTVEEVSVPE